MAKALAAYSAAADASITKEIVSFDGQVATAADIAALRLETDNKIEAIKNTANMSVSGTVYYVSSSTGSDSNSGTSPNAPLKTLSKANSKMTSGCTVCLKRGDIWRGEGLTAKSNVTITAYGEGPKPVIIGSPENGGGAANASKWTEVATNIWRYEGTDSWSDVGNIVFNDGESYATKIVQLYVKQESWSTYQITDYTNAPAQKYSFTSYTDLKNDLDFFHDKNFSGGSGATGYLYMYSTSNPALRFESIEFAPDIKLVEADVNGVTVDNICFKYTGGHAVAGSAHNFMSTQIKNLTVQNCEFYWIGGSVHQRISNSSIGTNTVEYDTRYGNAIEIYGGCDNFIARNNYIYQVFDAGITIQLTMSSGTTKYNQANIQFVDNVIEYCNYSIEYFLTKIPTNNSSSMSNFVISGNYMWNAGYGFCETRMIWGRGFAAHIKSQFTSPCNRATGFEITDNIMIGAKDGFLQIRNSFGVDSMPVFENNTLYGYYDFDGAAAGGFRIGEVRVKSEDTQEWVSYDTNIEAYLAENMGSKYGEGNKYYFIF